MINVVFATFNGSLTLQRMLPCLKKLNSPPCPWRIIAVDNESTDSSFELLRSFTDTLPLQVLRCSGRGKNRALNMALGVIDGDLIILTDDDVLPASDWLTQFWNLATTQTKYDIFGGVVRADFPIQPPVWVEKAWIPLDIAYAITEHGSEGATHPGWIRGPNMAVRRRVFESGLRFNDAVGPGPGQYAMGSETDFSRRAVAEGYQLWFSHKPVVAHQVRENQFSKDWLMGRAYRHGLGRASRMPTLNEPFIFGVPRWLWRQYLTSKIKAFFGQVLLQTEIEFRYGWQAEFNRGMVQHYRSKAKKKD